MKYVILIQKKLPQELDSMVELTEMYMRQTLTSYLIHIVVEAVPEVLQKLEVGHGGIYMRIKLDQTVQELMAGQLTIIQNLEQIFYSILMIIWSLVIQPQQVSNKSLIFVLKSTVKEYFHGRLMMITVCFWKQCFQQLVHLPHLQQDLKKNTCMHQNVQVVQLLKKV